MDIQSLFQSRKRARIALVTGGSRGIGKMFVEGLLAAGCARVYISARKVDQRMQDTIDEFGADRVIGIPCRPFPDGRDGQPCQRAEGAGDPARYPDQQCRGRVGSALSRIFPRPVGTERWTLNVKTPPSFLDSGAARSAGVRGQGRASGQGDPCLVNRWATDQPVGNLCLSGFEGRGDPADPAYGRAADRRTISSVTSIAPGAFPSEMNKAAKEAPDASGLWHPEPSGSAPAEDMAAAAILPVQPGRRITWVGGNADRGWRRRQRPPAQPLCRSGAARADNVPPFAELASYQNDRTHAQI